MVRWRRWLLAGAVSFAGCATEGTGPTPPPPPPGPTGMIYMQAGQNTSDPLVSIRVDSGELTYPPIPPVLGGTKNFRLFDGAVSNSDEVVAGAVLSVGKTFLWRLGDGAVAFHGDPLPTQDRLHVWSPSGRTLVFVRRRIDVPSPTVVVRWTPATAVQDTVLVPSQGQALLAMGWMGEDSLIFDAFAHPGGSQFRVLELGAPQLTPFAELSYPGFPVPPTFSPSRRWMAFLTIRDSTTPSGSRIQLLSRRHRDRVTGEELEYEADLFNDAASGSVSIAYSPDERFFATCENDTTIAIRAVSGAQVSRRLAVPYCTALSWTMNGER
jgi:hypothetical protein